MFASNPLVLTGHIECSHCDLLCLLAREKALPMLLAFLHEVCKLRGNCGRLQVLSGAIRQHGYNHSTGSVLRCDVGPMAAAADMHHNAQRHIIK